MSLFERRYITHPVTRSRKAIGQVRGVVCHWTANRNKGAGADAHFRYFNNGAPGPRGRFRAASAHYALDDIKTVQLLPESEIGFHVGDRSFAGHYRSEGVALMKGYKTPNFVTIGYEICVNEDSDFRVTELNSQMLAAWLLFRWKLRINDLYRHYDITGKHCPQMYLEAEKWKAYKSGVESQLKAISDSCVRRVVLSPQLNIRSGPGVQYPVIYAADKGEVLAVDAVNTNRDWVSLAMPNGQEAYCNQKFLSAYLV